MMKRQKGTYEAPGCEQVLLAPVTRMLESVSSTVQASTKKIVYDEEL